MSAAKSSTPNPMLAQAVTDTLRDRVARALAKYRADIPGGNGALVVAGGVAANKTIRQMLTGVCDENGFSLYAPPPSLCSDNAAIIAWAGLEHFEAGTETEAVPRSRWPLDANAEALIGAGRRGAKA